MNSRIRNLYCPVQSFGTSCCQCINYHNQIRGCLIYYSPYNFCRLHPGLCHHSRNDRTYNPASAFPHCIPSIFLHNMSGNIQLIHHIRSQCIRCHFTIAKAYNKYRISFFLIFFRIFHIFFQKTCQCLRYFPVIPFICSCHIRRFQCQICSHRFSHRLRPIFRFNPDRCDLNLLFFIILLFQNDT